MSKAPSGRPDRIVVQATMYDPVGLTAPWNVATSYVKADYEHRIRYWDCALTSNDVRERQMAGRRPFCRAKPATRSRRPRSRDRRRPSRRDRLYCR